MDEEPTAVFGKFTARVVPTAAAEHGGREIDAVVPGKISSETLTVPVLLFASVAVICRGNVPATVGIPESTPPVIVRPVGSPVAAQVTVPVAPVAVKATK